MSDCRHHRAAAAGLLAFALVSCDKSPTSPDPQPGGNPPAPTIVRLEITAPASIPPGVAVQLRASAIKSDGSSEDVTGLAQWSSSDSRTIRVNGTGLSAALAGGEAIITARYQSRSASARIFGLPPDTFKLAGRVAESGFPVAGVAIEVTDGIGRGLTATTAGDGTFALYGVAGRVELHARKAGYFNETERFDVVEHTTRDFEIVPERDRTDLSGVYSLTIEAAGCSHLLESARQRTYTAAVTQTGPALSVMLTGGDFIITSGRGDHFSGFVDPNDNATFVIGDPLVYSFYYGYYFGGPPDIAERLTPTIALAIVGNADARRIGSRVTGRLRGTFILVEGAISQITPLMRGSASCFSDSHSFEMVRQ
jgi:hypothetical protein